MATRTSPEPVGSAGNQPAQSFAQSLLMFLDRNLTKFSINTRNVIGIGVLVLLCVIALHAFLAPTYIQGHLFVQTTAQDTKAFAKRYIVIAGNESFLTNDNGYWMIPVRGFFPQPRRIQVQNASGELVEEFVAWAPWPVFNAIHLSEFEVVLHPYRPANVKRVDVAGRGPLDGAGRLFEAALGITNAHAQSHAVAEPFVLVHAQGLGDIGCPDDGWCGTKGEGRRIEGFLLRLPPGLGDVQLRYMCHLQGVGDSPWVREGQFCGTRGQSRRLEGFAIELTGRDAQKYRLSYRAYLQGSGDTRTYADGQFVGTRGMERRVEALRVHLESR